MGYFGRIIKNRGKALAQVPANWFSNMMGYWYMYRFHRQPDCIYFLAPYGIGDTLFLAALMKAFKKENKVGRVCFIVKNSHRDLPGMFDAVDEVIVSDKMVKHLRRFALNKRKFTFANFRFGHFILDFKWPEPGRMMGVKGVTLIDVYKRALLNLPMDSELEPAKLFMDIREMRPLEEQYPSDKPVAVLMPYAVTVTNLDPSFWNRIAAGLIRQGYRVYTNVTRDTEPVIEGTEPMNLSLKEFYCLASAKQWTCVALRSGICDLMAFSAVRMVVIHISEHSYDAWNMENLKLPNPRITEVILDDEDQAVTVREILKQLS